MKNTTIERTATDSLPLQRLRDALAPFLCAPAGERKSPHDVTIQAENWLGLQISPVFLATTADDLVLDCWAMGVDARLRPSVSLMQRVNRTSLHSLIDPGWSAWLSIADPRQRDESTTAEGPAASEPEPRYPNWIQCRPAAAQNIPAEIFAVANWLGVAGYLEEVRRFTAELFPGPMRITAAQDPDITDDCHIVFRVQASGEIRHILDRQDAWHRRLLSCTRPRSDAFRISIDAR